MRLSFLQRVRRGQRAAAIVDVHGAVDRRVHGIVHRHEKFRVAERVAVHRGVLEHAGHRVADKGGVVKKGDVVGKVVFSLNEEELASFDVTANDDVEEKSFGSILGVLLHSLIKM